MPNTFPFNLTIPYGSPSDFSVYVNEQKYLGLYYVHVVKKINQMDGFEAKILDVTNSDANMVFGSIVKIFSEDKLLFKGRVEEVLYRTDGSVDIKGYGMAILLANKEFGDRVSFNDSTMNIGKYFLSLKNDSTSPWVIEPKTLEDYGEPIVFRGEFDNKLQIVDALVRQLEWDWYVDHGDIPYNEDNFHIKEWRGSLAPTYDVVLSGATQNCTLSERKDNYNKLINSIVFLGPGEGASQLYTKFSLFSSVYDRLDQTIPSKDSMVVLRTAKGFPEMGVAQIGRMPVTWIDRTGNLLSNGTMDTQGGTLNDFHYKGTLCVLSYDATGKDYGQLTQSITSGDTTIPLDNTAGFSGAGGTVIISNEIITFTGKDSANLTGCTRGASGTTAAAHDQFVFCFAYNSGVHYTEASPQDGSSIDVNGLKQHTMVDPSKELEKQMEIEASNYLVRNSSITYEIAFSVMDYFEFLKVVDVGDRVRITDPDTGLAGNYRILGIDVTFDGGEVTLAIQASNKKITETTFIDIVARMGRTLENRLTYAQS